MEIKNRRSHADGRCLVRGVLHTAEGVECGVCVDTSGDAEPNADAMTPDAERSFRLYAAGLDRPGGTIRRVGQVIARDLLREIDRLRGEVLAYVAEADEQIRLRDEARAQLAALRAEVHGVLSELEEERNAVLAVLALLARIVKYEREDGAVTPRATRLARVCEEARALLARVGGAR
jgi:hypothetical protein